MGSYVVRLLSCRRFNDGLLPLLSVLITSSFGVVMAFGAVSLFDDVDSDISNVTSVNSLLQYRHFFFILAYCLRTLPFLLIL